MSLEDLDELLPSSENIFKQPDSVSHFPFHPLDIPEFSHFPIEDGNFGDLEFLDLASDRFLNKNKNLGQFSDIYFNSLATPSGYCSANYLTEEANRLSLLLSESGEREKGDVLDKSLIENLEELFGVASQGNKVNFTIDEQLPNVLGSIERKSNYDVEFEVSTDVLNMMAKNFENLETLSKASSDAGSPVEEPTVDKTITIKSVKPHASSEPPEGAVAKIILNSSKKNNTTRIIFSSIDDTEQHSFSLNTSNMRKAVDCLRHYNLDNMESLRRLLRLGSQPVSRVKTPPDPHVPETSPATTPSYPLSNYLTHHPVGASKPRHLNPTDGGGQLPPGGANQHIHLPGRADELLLADAVAEPVAVGQQVPGDGGTQLMAGEVEGRTVDGAASQQFHKSLNAVEKQLEANLAQMGINVSIGKVEVNGHAYLCCPYEDCTKAYSIAYDLKLHLMNHYSLKPYHCDHPGCSWSFVTSFKLLRHKKTHVRSKEFACTYNDCVKRFSTMYNLTVHLKAHGRPLQQACSSCSDKFRDLKQMEDHVARCHRSEIKPSYMCESPGCDKIYFSHKDFKSHQRCHSSQVFVCRFDNCGKQFRKSSHLQRHQVLHSVERKYVCDFEECKSSFKTSSKLARHRKIHEKNNPFLCDLCQKRFRRSEHLKTHYLIHSSEKTFHCLAEFCDKKFAGRVLLLNHIRKVHIQGKKTSSLLCPIADCYKRFVSRASFESHLTSHGKEMQENHLLTDSQDSSQLDFVALLSSVGEDILLPDELSCPEYEISSDLMEMNKMQEISILFNSNQEESTNTTMGLVLPEMEGAGEILISIQPQDNALQDQGNVFTVVQSGLHSFSLPRHLSNPTLGHQALVNPAQFSNRFFSQAVEDGFLISEEVGLPIEIVEEQIGMDEVDGAHPGEGQGPTLEEMVEDESYHYMDGEGHASSLGLCLAKSEQIPLVDPLEGVMPPQARRVPIRGTGSVIKHSTINLQDLK